MKPKRLAGYVLLNKHTAEKYKIPRQTLQSAAWRGEFGEPLHIGCAGELQAYKAERVRAFAKRRG